MSLTTSTATPLIVQSSSSNGNIPEYVTIINPDGSISYEPNTQYQKPTIIRRSYPKNYQKSYRYALEQVILTLVVL